jgi:hypothetical protein
MCHNFRLLLTDRTRHGSAILNTSRMCESDMVEAASTSETSVNFCHTTPRNSPEDSRLEINRSCQTRSSSRRTGCLDSVTFCPLFSPTYLPVFLFFFSGFVSFLSLLQSFPLPLCLPSTLSFSVYFFLPSSRRRVIVPCFEEFPWI